jgi:hypothetical protein
VSVEEIGSLDANAVVCEPQLLGSHEPPLNPWKAFDMALTALQDICDRSTGL